jgi:hypothetical protein
MRDSTLGIIFILHTNNKFTFHLFYQYRLMAFRMHIMLDYSPLILGPSIYLIRLEVAQNKFSKFQNCTMDHHTLHRFQLMY